MTLQRLLDLKKTFKGCNFDTEKLKPRRKNFEVVFKIIHVI